MLILDPLTCGADQDETFSSEGDILLLPANPPLSSEGTTCCIRSPPKRSGRPMQAAKQEQVNNPHIGNPLMAAV